MRGNNMSIVGRRDRGMRHKTHQIGFCRANGRQKRHTAKTQVVTEFPMLLLQDGLLYQYATRPSPARRVRLT